MYDSESNVTARILCAMIDFYKGNKHDISHFLKVYAYASTIGAMEGLDAKTKELTDICAITHDIACPVCREKYGSASGELQERESAALIESFLSPFGLARETVDRVKKVVSRHHTYAGVDGMDIQILLEADFLVNADEGSATPEAIESMKERVFKTKTGISLLKTIYQRA